VTGHELEHWRAALGSTRTAWQSAGQRDPATRCERALHAVAADDERDALPANYVGDCERCGSPIIAKRRGPPATYCSSRCRAAHVERRAA